MTLEKMNEKPIARIAHVKSHIDGFEEGNFYSLINNVVNNTGSVTNSMRLLSSYCTAKAVYAWFVEKDIVSVQNYFFATSLFFIRALSIEEERKANGINFQFLLPSLISKKTTVVKWYANNIDQYFFPDRIASHKSIDFWTYIPYVAIRGDWSTLKKLCNIVINDPPNNNFINKHFYHYFFYKALAESDFSGMQKIIDDMLINKYLKKAASYEGGFTADLICTPLLVLLNIAKLHGFSLKIDTPLVPLEWVYCAKLNHYSLPFDFMNNWVDELNL
ncbi:hypothetical protein LIN78_06385 [Leeia sp. TBRC 13508]|uniref:Uncharacterized protein n=1 Tax=Leeia speluncae TaxID=2884804 RepID=A0ABS8D4R1_9NEIS|nr:hypothetical protein [Leeia speluncae]MCB6183167.1 hypothetical protein [Leeia speluncae]